MYILVYKNRQFGPVEFNTDGTVSDLGGSMTVALLDTSLTGPQSPVSIVEFDDPLVSLGGAVKRDDWVMLINKPDPSAAPGFDRQLAFYRVVNFSEPNTDLGTPASITLDGPDFDFGPEDPDNVQTYIVHLKDVLGVYERTFTPELESNWNVSF